MPIYSRPTASLEDRLAHILSEIMNDNAPIGWERYRGPATCLLANQEVRQIFRDLPEQSQ